eukprot:TRINITY_DN8135_c0_g1_i3.p1 TRINITY_DN8135_c0_g1~~TRINITY_DN8135_c0_g1_i3.p1  ORF type:complete len:315 (-),score=55.70 TRINITY_DN8135_c0_g1_i3:25-969(-)
MDPIIQYDASKQSLFSKVTALVTLFLVTGSFYVLFFVGMVSIYYALKLQLWAFCVLVTFGILSYYPNQILWQDFIDCYIWRTWCEYFSFKVINKAAGKFDGKKSYMFAEFPHGVFPLGFILSATIVQKIFPGLRVEGATASVLFRIPILRQLSLWFGSRPATTKNIHKLIDQGSVGLLPGGIAEIFVATPKKEIIYLKKRKGFVRIALERGTDILPVYYFGNTQLFNFVGGPLEAICRKLRMSAILFYGRYYLPIPFQVPITMVIGDIISVKATPNPSEEDIDKLHAEVMSRMKQLFDEHKGAYGWGHKELIIV